MTRALIVLPVGLLTLSVGLLTPAPVIGAAGAAGLSAAELAQALQHKYDGVKDFSTDFTQVYQGGVVKKQLTERGRLLIKKPGKMRWEYTSPEHKLFVSDGAQIYSYIPEDNQVTIGRVPEDDEATTPALFLAGKGNLTRDFTVSLGEPPSLMPAGTLALKLVPKKPQADYDWLMLVVEPDSYHLRGLVSTDGEGGTSTFSFTNLKENIGPADKVFEFKPPRGVEVVTDSSRH
jgi:outer membrane lipoprotein carrier protein